jgi:hypothetical protein
VIVSSETPQISCGYGFIDPTLPAGPGASVFRVGGGDGNSCAYQDGEESGEPVLWWRCSGEYIE